MKQKRKKRKSPKNSWAQANQRTIYTEKPRGDLQLGREITDTMRKRRAMSYRHLKRIEVEYVNRSFGNL